MEEEDRRPRRRRFSDGTRVLARLRKLYLSPEEAADRAGVSVPDLLSVTIGSLHDVAVKEAVASLLGVPWEDLWPATAGLPTDPTIGPKLKMSPALWRQFRHIEPITDPKGIVAAIAAFHAETEVFLGQVPAGEPVAPAIEDLAVPPRRVEPLMAITLSGEEFGIIRIAGGFVLADGTLIKRRSQAINWFLDRAAFIQPMPSDRVNEFRQKSEDVLRYFTAERRFKEALKQYQNELEAYFQIPEIANERTAAYIRISDAAIASYTAAFETIAAAAAPSSADHDPAPVGRPPTKDASIAIDTANLIELVSRPVGWAFVTWHDGEPHLLTRISGKAGILTPDGRMLRSLREAIRRLIDEGSVVRRLNPSTISPEMLDKMRASADRAIVAWSAATLAAIGLILKQPGPTAMPEWEDFEGEAGPWRPRTPRS